MGTHKVFTDDDGWTVKTQDGKPSVHFEHDVCVKAGQALNESESLFSGNQYLLDSTNQLGIFFFVVSGANSKLIELYTLLE
jgi:hypothetical protein